MERVAKEASITATNYCKEEWLHLAKTIRQLRRKRAIIVIELPIAFLPRLGSVTPELFAKVFANERMRIELSRIMLIFRREKSRSS